MYNTAVPDIPLHRYKRNWPITCGLPETWAVLCGAFLFCQEKIKMISIILSPFMKRFYLAIKTYINNFMLKYLLFLTSGELLKISHAQ